MMHGRGLRPLFMLGAVTLLLLVGLYLVELWIPALHEMLLPVYWIVLGIAAVLTWRWLRERSRRDRRGEERRQEIRRDPSSPGAD
jgi:membrane protein implicated in regulation of membrane protease activity